MLATSPNGKSYIDVAAWATPATVIALLQELRAHEALDGIVINTSNYESTATMVAFCNTISAGTAGLHCIIDTSRNFNGSPQKEWCNAKSGGIGTDEMLDTTLATPTFVVYMSCREIPSKMKFQNID